MMIEQNPQLRQLTESNPELAHALRDPSLLRQAMQAATNPDFQRAQNAATDRAMANIEAHPGGFNALRQMYQNVFTFGGC